MPGSICILPLSGEYEGLKEKGLPMPKGGMTAQSGVQGSDRHAQSRCFRTGFYRLPAFFRCMCQGRKRGRMGILEEAGQDKVQYIKSGSGGQDDGQGEFAVVAPSISSSVN